MRSMTGYGKGVASENGITVTIELKSVNGKFLDISSKLPKSLMVADDAIRKTIGGYLSRGSVDVYFSYTNENDKGVDIQIDSSFVNKVSEAAKQLAKQFKMKNNLTVADIMRMPEAVKYEQPRDDSDLIAKIALSATQSACRALCEMRDVEGKTVREDLLRLVDNIERHLQFVIERSPQLIEDYRKQLRMRVSEMLKDVAIDETKLLNEVAFFADKADINEEINRLKSHISQYRMYCDSDEPVGRKLDFIAQEMNREINTMGSKSNDLAITTQVVAMKNELEKIKEQIRNVE